VTTEDALYASAPALRSLAADVLHGWGMPLDRATESAALIVESDLRGVDSHGISMLPQYERLVAEGRVDVGAAPEVVSSSDSGCLIDAHDSFGHLAMKWAMDAAVERATAHGVAAVGVRRSHHFGAAGIYATMASDRGMIGLVTTTTRTRAVVPTRGTQALLGTNPMAFAAPTDDPERPFLLDMSTSTVAVNKVKTYDHRGLVIPEGWVVDDAGHQLTDHAIAHRQVRAQAGGGLTPLGGAEATAGYKGYGLSVMVQILAGALTGSTFAPHRSPSQHHDDIGHFCLVIDPGAFGSPEVFLESVAQVVTSLRQQQPAVPGLPVLVAGDPEWAARRRREREGVPLSRVLARMLTDLAHRSGVDALTLADHPLDQPYAETEEDR
jgi:LDH2 family malate/lactate/ureidoglycolate dehydrogenase